MQCTYGSLPYSSNPNLSFPIPHEKEYRVEKVQEFGQKSNNFHSYIRIEIREVSGLINLAYMPIRWRGKDCITTRQLEEARQLLRNQTLNK